MVEVDAVGAKVELLSVTLLIVTPGLAVILKRMV
jgi:hypothetical protein